jgi:hypothetical protein
LMVSSHYPSSTLIPLCLHLPSCFSCDLFSSFLVPFCIYIFILFSSFISLCTYQVHEELTILLHAVSTPWGLVK